MIANKKKKSKKYFKLKTFNKKIFYHFKNSENYHLQNLLRKNNNFNIQRLKRVLNYFLFLRIINIEK